MRALAPGLAAAWIAFVYLRFLIPPPALIGEIGLDRHPLALAELPLLATAVFVAWIVRCRRTGDGRLRLSLRGAVAAWLGIVGLAFLYLLGWRSAPAAVPVSGTGVLHALATIGVMLGVVGAIAAIAFLVGRRVLCGLGLADERGSFVPALGFGVIAFAFGAFALAAFGLLSPVGVCALGLALAATGAREWHALRDALGMRWQVDDARPLVVASVWAVGLTSAIGFASLLRATPVGWDDLTAYMNRAQELASTGALSPGGAPYPTELLYALGFALGEGLGFPSSPDTLALAVAGAGGLLGVVSLVWLGLQARSWSVGWVAAALYATMPMVVHLSTADMKVDTLLFAFLCLALGCALRWRRRQGDERAWLVSGAVFLGFALGVKATASFAIAGLVAIALRDAISTGGFARTLRDGAIAAAICAVMLAPWAAWHVLQRGGAIARPLDLATGHDPGALPPDALWRRAGLPGPAVAATGLEEERGRYRGFEQGWWCTTTEPAALARRDDWPWWCIERALPDAVAAWPVGRLLSLPWDVSLSRNVPGFYAAVGPAYLALLPVMAMLRSRRREPDTRTDSKTDTDGTRAALGWFGGVHLVAWMVGAWGIPWYGVGMFAAFAVLIGDFVLGFRGGLHVALAAPLSIGVLVGLAGAVERLPRLCDLDYLMGRRDRTASVDARFPAMQGIAQAISQQPGIVRGDRVVLRIGSMLPYFVPRHRERLLDDTHLDQWNAVDVACARDDDCTLAALQRAGVALVVYDLSTPAIDRTPFRTLERKALRFRAFADRRLEVVRLDPVSRIALLAVPGRDPESGRP